ncbi:granulin b [Dunckerocampus dactyliophorus]|uniref:granulin b n=1 Tax=Dunckerocampus dactyliophorus TaxID=161453 RepID=UPI0024056751|nr:granulin b [Dunckerocampus dactyliophorus]XP_054622866.1 granulin b [Dunckerocampus dactyliophorus]XP_054622867.1 granulin b [Dunckerocampus dactyliophorus]
MALQISFHHCSILGLTLLTVSTALVCPDGGVCEDKSTCCKSTVGGYGCCPLPHAVCCSDGLHCCFEGTVCDLLHARCVNKTTSLPWVRPRPPEQLSQRAAAVMCPDQQSECPDTTTCCQLPDGAWGCCPLAKAVCCEDKRHCCPEGTTCDLVHSMCASPSGGWLPLLGKLPARSRAARDDDVITAVTAVASVTCPGGGSSCPDTFTCCLLASGDYGCCPYPDAMCCGDHVHCCPRDSVCDLQHGLCQSADYHVPLSEKLPAWASDMECPDKTSVCPDKTTCCQTISGEFACCPMPDAVCCADHLHCCPHGTVCNMATATCDHPADGTVWPRIALAENTKCDESVSCPGLSTCCRTTGGGWACCPLEQAVCCDDHLHCCPHGKECNLEAETCDDPLGVSPPLPWVAKMAAVQDEECDQQTVCPAGSTCCKVAAGQWACCPLPQAVCCDDLQHCCPGGYKCNVAEQTCDKPGQLSLPWFRKTAARQRLTSAGKMCDDRTSCPSETSCCFMKRTHTWGCCPLLRAVCCDDGEHCCPAGHVCEPHRASCSRGHHVVPWLSKIDARTRPAAVADIKCDDKSSCAAGTTCCKLPTGEWGCCPLVKAVCCPDREHCCPQGYTCNMETGTCEKAMLAVEAVPANDTLVPCDVTGLFGCPERETCCQNSNSEWACCPSPGAVCCADLKQCCPAGFSCDLKTGSCSPTLPTWDRTTDL